MTISVLSLRHSSVAMRSVKFRSVRTVCEELIRFDSCPLSGLLSCFQRTPSWVHDVRHTIWTLDPLSMNTSLGITSQTLSSEPAGNDCTDWESINYCYGKQQRKKLGGDGWKMEAISPHFDDGITNTQLELLVSIGHQGKEIHHNSSWKTIMMNRPLLGNSK